MSKWNITPHSMRRGIVFVLKVILVVIITIPFYFILEGMSIPYNEKGNWLALALYGFLFIILGSPYDVFRIGILRIRELYLSSIITIILTNFISYIVISLISRQIEKIFPFLILLVVQIIIMAIYYIVSNKIYYSLYPARDTVFIHANSDYERDIVKKFQYRDDRYNIRNVFIESESINVIKKALLENNTVIIGQVDPLFRQKIVNFCYENNKRIFFMPSVEDIVLQNSHVIQISDSLLFLVKNRAMSLEQMIVKRLIDIIFSFFFLLFTFPLLVVIAIIIKATDGGPVFLKQKRYTRNKEIFEVIKFRSMIVDAEKNGAQLTVDDDNRITNIGKFIRKTRIDEIPQFLNVLKGDMSIVGPRAERIENVDKYTKSVPEFALRMKVKAGITGYAQIYGKYNTSPEDKARMDIFYIQNFSIKNDFRLMLATIKVIFKNDATEGFKDSFLGGKSG